MRVLDFSPSIMPTMNRALLVTAFATALAASAPSVAAQAAAAATTPAAPAALRVAPSGRATVTVNLARPRPRGTPAPATPVTPVRITIDYGQPHARGRQIVGTVIPMDTVWRTGANAATAFTTDVDLMIGDTRVPKGVYTMFTLPTRAGWQLIVSKKTGQWGTEYDAAHDFARIPLRARTIAEPLDSFTIWLVPATDAPARGMLKMAWGTTELAADWKVVE